MQRSIICLVSLLLVVLLPIAGCGSEEPSDSAPPPAAEAPAPEATAPASESESAAPSTEENTAEPTTEAVELTSETTEPTSEAIESTNEAVAESTGTGPTLGDCPVFPADNIWNTRIDSLPVHANSDDYIETIGAEETIHPDFGSGEWEGAPICIPFVVVPADQPLVDIEFTDAGDESDPGPYPIPADAPIEGGPDSDGDRHVLVVQEGDCRLYELYYAFPEGDSWAAFSGAVFDLNSHDLRPDGWTSADAAGLPVLPGLIRYDEVAAGEIKHAIRVTAPETQEAYVWPARHQASEITEPNYPPMGTRFRLRSDFPVDDFDPQLQVILRAMQQYGLILADNGSAWFISGTLDDNWDNDLLHELGQVQGSDFEVVDVSSLQIDPDSGQAQQADN